MYQLTQNDFTTYLQLPKHFWARVHNQTEASVFQNNLPIQQVRQLAADYTRKVLLPNFPEAKLHTNVYFQTKKIKGRADAIVEDTKTNEKHLVAFKASTSSNKRYIQQLAFQVFAAKKEHTFSRIFMVLLSPHYLKSKQIEIEPLFQVVEVSTAVREELKSIGEKIEQALRVAEKKSPEDLFSCVQPERCPCLHLCHPNLPEYSIYDASGLRSREIIELRDKGVLKLEDIPIEYLGEKRQLEQRRLTQEKSSYIDKDSISKELNLLEYPVHFLDYEAYGFPIPLYQGYWPLSSVVFQFSLHTLTQEGELSHQEFLHVNTSDPSSHLIKALKTAIPEKGSIVVWDKTLESQVHNHLAQLRTEHLLFLLDLNQRLFDLQKIFSKGLYNDYRFKGSVSLKKVLPVFAPELDHKNLEVSNGLQAAQLWYELVYDKVSVANPSEREKNLREYCQRDTLGCVEICKKLIALS